MRILVCGGRKYADRARVFGVLDALHTREHSTNNVTHVTQGGAEGADALAREWAQDRRVTLTTHWAKWTEHGKPAGPIRNDEMAKEEALIGSLLKRRVLVLAFPGGRGTRDMVTKAKAAGLRVVEVE